MLGSGDTMWLGVRQSVGVLLIGSLCFPAVSWAKPEVLVLPTLGSPRAVSLAGRVLKEAPSGGGTFTKNVGHLFASKWEGAPVVLSFEGFKVAGVTGEDGSFSGRFEAAAGSPFSPGIHSGFVQVGQERPVVIPVEVVSDAAPFLVISDFDDTVAVTHVTSKRKLLQSALLQDGDSQPAVKGMGAFYTCLTEGKQAQPGVAFVSGSPIQFAPRIRRFLNKNRFPFAALYLREIRLDTLSGYKEPVLRRLLAEFTNPVVLVGDSGERDPEVYTTIRSEFPGRVLEVYIRDAGGDDRPERFDGMVRFKDGRAAAEHAADRGLANRACVEKEFSRRATSD